MNIRHLNRIVARIDAFFEANSIECEPAVVALVGAALMIVCCIGGFC